MLVKLHEILSFLANTKPNKKKKRKPKKNKKQKNKQKQKTKQNKTKQKKKKTGFLKPFWQSADKAKQWLNAKILISRLRFFSVLKIMVVWHV